MPINHQYENARALTPDAFSNTTIAERTAIVAYMQLQNNFLDGLCCGGSTILGIIDSSQQPHNLPAEDMPNCEQCGLQVGEGDVTISDPPASSGIVLHFHHLLEIPIPDIMWSNEAPDLSKISSSDPNTTKQIWDKVREWAR